ncbi:MAG: dTMP kinase [Thermotogaceae bacterium]|nr:dTMP kinase [Thermotogaceae bacterium]
MKKGVFISFEGIDGSGKTTQIEKLKNYLDRLNVDYVIVREPGGTNEGERIRQILLDKDSYLTPEAELFLLLASRSILTKRIIIPSLEREKIVIADRYADSSVAYQGYGRGLDIEFVNSGNARATYGLEPDITFYIDIPVEESIKRRKEKKIDRMEKDSEFLKRVREGYLKMAKELERIKLVNGTMSPDKVWKVIKKEVEELLRRKNA